MDSYIQKELPNSFGEGASQFYAYHLQDLKGTDELCVYKRAQNMETQKAPRSIL